MSYYVLYIITFQNHNIDAQRWAVKVNATLEQKIESKRHMVAFCLSTRSCTKPKIG